MADFKVTRPTVRVRPTEPQPTVPEDYSVLGETIKGLPKAFSKVVGQPTLRAYAGVGSAATGETLTPSTDFQRNLYGSGEQLSAEESGRELVGEKAPAFVAGGIGFGLGIADLFGGSGTAAKRNIQTLKGLSKLRSGAKAASSYDEAVKLLRSGKISNEVINTFKLGDRLVGATDDAQVNRLFREAAQAESIFQTTGKVPTTSKITRPSAETKSQVGRTKFSDMKPPTRVSRQEQAPRPSTLARPAVLNKDELLRGDTLDKADEARFIDEEVMPKIKPDQQQAVLNKLPTLYKETIGYTIDTVRNGDTSLVSNQIEANFRDVAGTLGLNTDKDLKGLVKEMTDLLDQNPQVARQVTAPDNFFWQRSTTPAYLRNNRQAGFASVPDAFKKPKQTQAAKDVVSRIDRAANNDEIIQPNVTSTAAAAQPSNVDNVINEAKQKYDAISNIAQGTDSQARLAQKRAGLQAGQLASDLLTPISSRLGRINKSLKFKVRNLEIETRRLTTERLEAVLPLMNATKKMTPTDKAVFDLALKNGDATVINAIGDKYGIQNELASARKMLDDVFKSAEEVGLDVSYRGDFFPRQVKNPSAFSQYLRGRDDWGEIRKALEQKAEQAGKRFTDLTDDEIAAMTNNLLRGYGSQITLATPGPLKARTIEEIGTELNKYYENSNTALLTYVHKMTDEIEGRKFFGKALGSKPTGKNPLTGEDMVMNTDDSIGAYIMKLIADGEITADQQDEVAKILKARFKKGNMNGLVSAYRDMEYISTMGNPISAITQIGDLAFAVYKNGFYNTLRGVGGTITRKNLLTKESLGIERIAQEFDNPAKTSKALEKVFKMVGMEQIDRLGKESFLESSRLKLKTLANKGDDELISDLNFMFDEVDALKALEELKDGAVTVRTKEVIMNRLMDFQPIAKSEMPVKYLEMPNGRILYMLKSFTLKQYDVFRREAIDKIISGNKKEAAEGIKNLTYLAGTFMLANATADEIKDLVLGRETPPSDRVVDNIYRLFGASKFDVYNSRERGLGFAVMQRILPPASVFDRLSTDTTRLIEDKTYQRGPLEGERYKSEAVQSIPGGGKLYYWWFGRGAQKTEYRSDTENKL